MVREGRVFISVATDPDFGSGYSVQALEVGAQVASGSSGTTVTVRAGHGFAAGDKYMNGTTVSTYSGSLTVQSVTSTTLTLSSPYSVAAGDLLVNLGADTGVASPNYNGNGLAIYTDMAYANQATNNTVTADAYGRYRYWHKGINRWELVRTGTTLTALYTDTGSPADEDQTSYQVRYAHLFATSGTGTVADPWVTDGSNALQAAFNDLPSTGGTVYMVPGHYTLGSATAAVTVTPLSGTTDKRGYVFQGAGRDLVFLEYSGTGSAFRYIGDAFQSNQLAFKGFSVTQTGTARTGNGFWMSYISESLFEDLSVGCPRMDRDSGETDSGFDYGFKIVATSGSHVVDFNRFHRVYCLGNTTGMYVDNQGDNLVVSESSFEPRRDKNVAQDGLHVHNSSGVTIIGCHFNFFHFDANSFGLKISGSSKGTAISGCYFENCKTMCFLYTDQDQHGTSITGCSFSFTAATTSYGVRAGLDGFTYKCKGLLVAGNSFFNIGAGNTGVRIGAEVRGFTLTGNGYDNQGGTDRTIQAGAGVDTVGVAVAGARGVISDILNETNYQPVIQLIDCTASAQGEILLQNFSTSATASPRLHLIPGTGGGSFGCYLAVTATGDIQLQNTAGTAIWTLAQAGHVTSTGTLRRSVSAAVTASTTHTQVGATALTADVNNVSVCANVDDAVALPTAVAGMTVVVMNNGAQNLRIWPASGDNLGTGVDTVRGALAAGSNARFTAYDATNWEEI